MDASRNGWCFFKAADETLLPRSKSETKPLLENPKQPWEHVAISTLGQNNHTIRDERWRYILYADGSEELYDHTINPNEWYNLVSDKIDPVHVKVIESLKKHLPTVNLPQVLKLK